MTSIKMIEIENEGQTRTFGEKLGHLLKGGEVIELIGDVGAGKTTFVKGLGLGLDVNEDVQSPSFTISRVYTARGGLQLAHYDFYRLTDPGIMVNELTETTKDHKMVTVVEWGDIVDGVLPEGRIRVTFIAPSETTRRLIVTGDEKIISKL